MIIFILSASILPLILILGLIEFLREKEAAASIKTTVILIIYVLVIILLHAANTEIQSAFVFVIWLGVMLLFLPYRSKKGFLTINKEHKYDERDIMFSRNELQPNTDRFNSYYSKNPDKLKPDNAFRKEPGLLSPQSKYYHPKAFEAADQYFSQIKKLHNSIKGEVSPSSEALGPESLSQKIKKMALEFGALHCGITELKPHHLYSHKGRGEEYGDPIKSQHRFAIAFTVEMDHRMVQAAPKASIVMESAHQYYRSAQIAVKITEYLRSIGFNSRPHIDGNYQVICPLVASDAGLGQLGRMGLLMTPDYGPRVRIGVVTTTAVLSAENVKSDYSVEKFCLLCRKCAVCCPSQSIPENTPRTIDGAKGWKIDSESCFTYWCKVGTDCGRCMAVCPYSHPNTLFHRFIRWGIRNNQLFLYLAVYFDDFFYGRKPKSKKLPPFLSESE